MSDRSKRFVYDDTAGLTITPPLPKFDQFLRKYDPNQPRAPKGSTIGGQFIAAGASAGGYAGEPPTTLEAEQAQAESAGLKGWLTADKIKKAASTAAFFGAGTASTIGLADVVHFVLHLGHIESNVIAGAIEFGIFTLGNKLGVGPETAWETVEHTVKKLYSTRALELSEAWITEKVEDPVLAKLQLILNLLYQSQYATTRRKSMSPLAKLFQKFNPNHDPKDGKFTSGPGGLAGDKDGDGDVDGWDRLPGTGKTVGGEKFKPNTKPRNDPPAEDVGDLSPLGDDVQFWRAVAEKVKGMSAAERVAYMAEVDRLIDLTTPGKK